MTTRPIQVGVFVGTRADLGPLVPVVEELSGQEDMVVTLFTGVEFDVADLRRRLPEALRERLGVVAIAPTIDFTGGEDVMVRHGALLSEGISDFLSRSPLDVGLVLGDRWELLYVVSGLFLARVPIVHLHGGEVTEGAIDDRVRHAVTKLADQHCVATMRAGARVRAMGEPFDRVHVVGAPGLDRLRDVRPATSDALQSLVGGNVRRPLVLFTYHPPTLGDPRTLERDCAGALQACLATGGTVIATYPGRDQGRDSILKVLEESKLANDDLVVVEALGRDYPEVLAASDMVVGNSSSGVIEAASLGVPAVDIGERQRGRERGTNVVHADEGFEAVSMALRAASTPAFRASARLVTNPYGDGRASGRICEVVRVAPSINRAKASASTKAEI